MGSPRSAVPWIALTSALVACGPADLSGQGESSASGAQAIYGGTSDANGDEAVVAIRVGTASPYELCSGSLIAPNVVLTARHCVSQVLNATVSCDQNGQSLNGNHVGADLPVGSIRVFTGAAPNLNGAGDATATQLVHPQGGVLCNGDVAFVILDQSIPGVTPLRVRLARSTLAGESTRAVGYGVNDQSLPVGTRVRKDAVSILAIGSNVSSFGTPLASHEFEVGLSICQGDSGGPALSETTGAVIGVVSRGGGCTDVSGHVYTETAGFQDLVAQAFAIAGGSVTEESAPTTSPDAGAAPSPGSDAGTADPSPSGAAPPIHLRSGAGASGCSLSAKGIPRGVSTTWLLLLGAAALLGARRKR